MSWSEVKKINSDFVNTPLNHLIWLNDYKIYGQDSYVYRDTDIWDELMHSKIAYYDNVTKAIMERYAVEHNPYSFYNYVPYISAETKAKIKGLTANEVYDLSLIDSDVARDCMLMNKLMAKFFQDNAKQQAIYASTAYIDSFSDAISIAEQNNLLVTYVPSNSQTSGSPYTLSNYTLLKKILTPATLRSNLWYRGGFSYINMEGSTISDSGGGRTVDDRPHEYDVNTFAKTVKLWTYNYSDGYYKANAVGIHYEW